MKKINESRSVIRSVEKWKSRLQLEHWKMKVEMMGGDFPDSPNVAAECLPLVPYQTATVRIYPKFFLEPEKERDEIIAHELCHCLTEEYKDLFRRSLRMEFVAVAEEQAVNERLTSWIARLVV